MAFEGVCVRCGAVSSSHNCDSCLDEIALNERRDSLDNIDAEVHRDMVSDAGLDDCGDQDCSICFS